MTPLTRKQLEALRRLAEIDGLQSARELGLAPQVLASLYRRGLARGNYYEDRVCYGLSPLGRRVLAEIDAQAE